LECGAESQLHISPFSSLHYSTPINPSTPYSSGSESESEEYIYPGPPPTT